MKWTRYDWRNIGLILFAMFIITVGTTYLQYNAARDECIGYTRGMYASGFEGDGTVSLFKQCMESEGYRIDYWQNWYDKP